MKSIKLTQLSLRYFKGIKEQTINFNENTTNIFGDNATGKSTIFDAFTWLLFGKDSQGLSDTSFSIKTLDKDGKVIPKVDHEVSAVLNVGGYELKLKRTLREKWETKRGTSIPVFTGNETVCEFDDIPVSITEYNKRIAGLLDETLFKLITNPLYFNSLNWKDRRKVLIDLAGEVTNELIIQLRPEFSNLIAELNGKTLEDLKSKTAQQKKAIKQQLDQIPTRIDEVRKGMPEAEDYETIEKEIVTIEKEIASIDAQISDRSKAIQGIFDEIQNKRLEISGLQAKQNKIINDAKTAEWERSREANSLRLDKQQKLFSEEQKLQNLKRQLQQIENDLFFSQRIADIENQIIAKRKEFEATNNQEFAQKSEHLICPLYKFACKDKEAVALFNENSENLSAQFNQDKITSLERINREGMALSEQKKELEKKLNEHNETIADYKTKIQSQSELVEKLKSELAEMPEDKEMEIIPDQLSEWVKLDNEIDNIKATIPLSPEIDNAELTAKKSELNAELNTLKSKLNSKQIIENSEKRIAELDNEQSKLAQQIADLDKIEFDILEFNKAKMEEVDRRVNGMFKHVKFKLFDTQINGGEVETCDTLINTNGSWVPYITGGNTAGKINAGIDIINALCKANGITAPIFVDNRESVNELIPTQSQIINLIVSNDKKLVVK
ncbi:MAG: AAA family ATPase [Porphyromonadaceae bacterium]|nr:AAA family ATPase [Porphyromonadaceae bacterium]